jgi:flagellar FliJ protein
MEKVAQVTKGQEDEAAKMLGECQGRLQVQEQTLQNLQEYYQQYTQEMTQASGSGMSIQRYQNMQGFLGNLTKALEQQTQVVEQVRSEYEHKKGLWLDKRNRNKALGSVTEKLRFAEDVAEEKKLQRDIDDRSSRQTGGKT